VAKDCTLGPGSVGEDRWGEDPTSQGLRRGQLSRPRQSVAAAGLGAPRFSPSPKVEPAPDLSRSVDVICLLTARSAHGTKAKRLQPAKDEDYLDNTMSANRPDEEKGDDKDRHLEEEVDEALEESFPASDPPSFTRGERDRE
jgi:hypothetical protein